MTRYSREYLNVLGSDRWQTLRAMALRRAGFRCERCGRPARAAGCPLDVHHSEGYRRLGHERLDELVVLCRYPCHQRAHGRRGYGRFGWRRLHLRPRVRRRTRRRLRRTLVVLAAVLLVLLYVSHPS